MIRDLENIIQEHPGIQQCSARVSSLAPGEELVISGTAGSLDALVIASLHENMGRKQMLCIARDRDTALRVADDIRLLIDASAVKLFLSEHMADQKAEDVDALRALASGASTVLVTHPLPLLERLPPASTLKSMLMTFEVGTHQSFDKTVQMLTDFGFERKEFVETIGDFSVRGGIVDVYPFVGDNPIRTEFFGDKVESIREFDPLSQRSIRELSAATIVPDLLSQRVLPRGMDSLINLLPEDSILVIDQPDVMFRTLRERSVHAEAQGWSVDRIQSDLLQKSRVVFSAIRSASEKGIDLGALPQPAFNGSVKIFRDHLHGLVQEGYRILISCETQSELKRLKELLVELPLVPEEGHMVARDESFEDLTRIRFCHHSIDQGFLIPDIRIALYTEHELFGRRKRRGRKRRTLVRGLSARDLQRLRKGDYVVHADYGIGRFRGLKKINIQSVEHEVLKILYKDGDVLYVNLNYVNRVQKYSSKEGHVPMLTRLGSSEWQMLKSRAKKRIKDLARELIHLYSRRKKSQGFLFHPDTPWQKELEASFFFEDTIDQARATLEVKQDMEAPYPMERLICGDVGFGKTEVAIRAAFKAVMSGKQVAILVPTTILAIQHRNTFVDRLSRYSVNIETISRLKSKKEQTEVLRRLRDGIIDIIIGTHRLLSHDVVFKDLGLLVIDEEHRFGVASKEKLRQHKAEVDTVTLTATPIPRTLHFSLMGARDLSIIATPPRNRLPIITEIIEFDQDLIRDAVVREVQRGGQVYFVHDRVHDIMGAADRMKRVIPDLRVKIAHGQMHSRELEDVMVEFLEKQFDVLVCTKIIESGLDIPNVNTILIDRADRFGMAELYQLRGRVGRSNVQAYAYLITPPISLLSKDALDRLHAMQEFTELGAGFHLAMRDLEIRGAGNLLGSEQSGFITNMGFETYARVLEEAVGELKQEEFQDIYEKPVSPVDGTIVEADVEAFIPREYISSDDERLGVYRRLYQVTTEDEVAELEEELEDRFGSHPPQLTSLLKILRLRLKGSMIGLRKIKIGRDAMEIELPPRTDETFYSGEGFKTFLSGIALNQDRNVLLRESADTLLVRIMLNQELDTLTAASSSLRTFATLLWPGSQAEIAPH